MDFVEQLADGRWFVQPAAMCHMVLAFSIIYNIVIVSVHSLLHFSLI